jgi:hypothetical protein
MWYIHLNIYTLAFLVSEIIAPKLWRSLSLFRLVDDMFMLCRPGLP